MCCLCSKFSSAVCACAVLSSTEVLPLTVLSLPMRRFLCYLYLSMSDRRSTLLLLTGLCQGELKRVIKCFQLRQHTNATTAPNKAQSRMDKISASLFFHCLSLVLSFVSLISCLCYLSHSLPLVCSLSIFFVCFSLCAAHCMFLVVCLSVPRIHLSVFLVRLTLPLFSYLSLIISFTLCVCVYFPIYACVSD